ncbi:MAG: DUF502 domain-containing protein [Planctomycetes bacterium]|nr:DUF502 domain-containing protein [Planctomycetota bacterium]
MAEEKKKQKVFIRGIIILLPTLITVFLLLLAFNFLNNNIAKPLGGLIISIINLISPLIPKDNALWKTVIGFPIFIIIIYMVGVFTATLVGKHLFKDVEGWIMNRFPLVKEVYPYAKQFIDTFISTDKKTEFKAVVAFQYPRPGVYAVGFVTADGLKDLREHTGKKIITVFLPTSPAPFTGFTLFMPADEVVHLNMTIDEAIRIIMSGGVLVPPHQMTEKHE